MEILKNIAYITACLLLGVVWFITFALGYIMQGTWAGAACFAINAAINISFAMRIETGDGDDGDREMIYNDYMYNQRFREIVDKYCQKHGCTVDEALTHDLIKQVHQHYTEV